MFKKNFALILLFAIFGCRPTPFKVGTIRSNTSRVEETDKRLVDDLEAVLNESMTERYNQAGKPSFGLINGFYKLPSASPYGAASIVRSYSYRTYVESIEMRDKKQDYAIEPMSGDDAIALQRAFNSLLDIGVKIKDIRMSDALSIAQAEEQAAKSSDIFQAKKVLPPNVDYLMSIYQTNSERGPILVGRVIKSDGTLIAFRVIQRMSNKSPIDRLILSLFEDTIGRIR